MGNQTFKMLCVFEKYIPAASLPTLPPLPPSQLANHCKTPPQNLVMTTKPGFPKISCGQETRVFQEIF